MKIRQVCPFCGQPTELELNNDQYMRFTLWREGTGLIQNLLPDLNSSDRELLITGMCYKCQDSVFSEEV